MYLPVSRGIGFCLFAFEIQYGSIVMVVVKGEGAGQKVEYTVAEYASDVAPGRRWDRS